MHSLCMHSTLHHLLDAVPYKEGHSLVTALAHTATNTDTDPTAAALFVFGYKSLHRMLTPGTVQPGVNPTNSQNVSILGFPIR